MLTHHAKKLLAMVIRVTFGIFFIALGIIGGFIPILQGWIFILIGLVLLSYDVPFIRRFVERLVKRYPRHADRMHHFSEWCHTRLHLPRWHLPGMEHRRLRIRRRRKRRTGSVRNPASDLDCKPGE